MNSIHSLDPRYKSGQYENTAGANRAAASARLNWSADNHPLNNGWVVSHTDDKDRIVYSRDGLEARYLADLKEWFIAPIGCKNGTLFKLPFGMVCDALDQRDGNGEEASI